MIKITNKAIDEILGGIYRAHQKGTHVELNLEIMNRVKREKQHLYGYIQSGLSNLSKVSGENGELIRAGYISGAHLTYSIIEEQLRIDRKKSPEISREDIRRSSKCAVTLKEIHGNRFVLSKLEKLQREENSDFGNYALNYILKQAFHEMVGRGWAMGAMTTYSIYEQAFARQK